MLDINDKIKKAIVETVVFFDLFDYPLTIFEIWQYLSVKCKLADIKNILDGVKIREKGGFYFLDGREEIVKIRIARYNYSNKKFKRTIWISRIFKFIPWIKMIAIGNIIGKYNLKKKSDIDLFIITEKNRLFITRLFCVGIIKILGLRPSVENKKDKICLSFFVSEEGMDLKKLMLKENKDLYFTYWLVGLVPIYDVDKFYNKLIKMNNWIYDFFPNWDTNWDIGWIGYNCDVGKNFSYFYHDIFDMFFGGLNSKAKRLQFKIMSNKLKDIMNQDTRVVINNKVLKLHSVDRRRKYAELFIYKLKKVLL